MAEQQPVTPMKTSQRVRESSRTRSKPVALTHINSTRKSARQILFGAYPWLTGCCPRPKSSPSPPTEASKRPRESLKTRYQPVTLTHVKLKRSQCHISSIKPRPWLPDYCADALRVSTTRLYRRRTLGSLTVAMHSIVQYRKTYGISPSYETRHLARETKFS